MDVLVFEKKKNSPDVTQNRWAVNGISKSSIPCSFHYLLHTMPKIVPFPFHWFLTGNSCLLNRAKKTMYLTRLICFAHDLVLGIPLPSLVEVAIRREREREMGKAVFRRNVSTNYILIAALTNPKYNSVISLLFIFLISSPKPPTQPPPPPFQVLFLHHLTTFL